MATPPLYLTLEQAAESYGVAPRTIRRRIAEGHLPAYRMTGSRLIRVRASDLDALMVAVPTAEAVN